ncbi:MAG TPA: tyrosine-type recombinase/integrase [Actinophytocola sp.]|jgi:integrase|nr:tyrosine-type recombinase/integrase [Actinophytocola sp.]
MARRTVARATPYTSSPSVCSDGSRLLAGPDGRLFRGPKGATPRRTNFNGTWKAAVRKAGANPDLHLHDLRHAGATLTAQTGATLKEIMSRIGHASTRAALIYQHATSKRDYEIATALDALIREARTAAQEGEGEARETDSGG